MPPFLEVIGYAPCDTRAAAKQNVANYKKIIGELAISDPEVNRLLRKNIKLLQKGEATLNNTWYHIMINGYKLSTRLHMMPWEPEVFPDLAERWVEVGLLFEYHEVTEGDTYTQPETRFPMGAGPVFWRLMNLFAQDFGTMGVYFLHESDDYPWEVLHGDAGSLWKFILALIPESLMDSFGKPPEPIISEQLPDGIGLRNQGTESWPIYWQESPWKA